MKNLERNALKKSEKQTKRHQDGDASRRRNNQVNRHLLFRSRFGHLGGRSRLRSGGLSRRCRRRGPTTATARGHDARLAASRGTAMMSRRTVATGSPRGQLITQTQEATAVAAVAAVAGVPAGAAIAAVAGVPASAAVRTISQSQEAAAVAAMGNMSADTRVSRPAVTTIATAECQIVGRTRHRHHQHNTVHSTNLPRVIVMETPSIATPCPRAPLPLSSPRA
jgi:hypothetical protein